MRRQLRLQYPFTAELCVYAAMGHIAVVCDEMQNEVLDDCKVKPYTRALKRNGNLIAWFCIPIHASLRDTKSTCFWSAQLTERHAWVILNFLQWCILEHSSCPATAIFISEDVLYVRLKILLNCGSACGGTGEDWQWDAQLVVLGPSRCPITRKHYALLACCTCTSTRIFVMLLTENTTWWVQARR